MIKNEFTFTFKFITLPQHPRNENRHVRHVKVNNLILILVVLNAVITPRSHLNLLFSFKKFNYLIFQN